MTRTYFSGAVLGVVLLLAPALQAQNAWTISPTDSFANFTVKHLMMFTVHGQMGGMKGKVTYDPKDPSKDTVDATLDVGTLSTGTTTRDDQLKSDYFDTKNFPLITFKSTSVTSAGPGKLKVTGNLTIKGTTRQVVLDVDGPSGVVKDAQGRQKVGVSATATLSRKAFGIVGTGLDGAVEAGGIVVSDEVGLELDMELVPAGAGATPPAVAH